MYSPYTLPSLPRKQCQFEETYTIVDRKNPGAHLVKYRLCTGVTHPNGWCIEHQYVQEVLDLAASVSYPELQVNAHLWIGSRIAAWEAYCVRVPFERYTPLKKKLQALKRELEQGRAAMRMSRVA